MKAAVALSEKGIAVRVISVPSTTVFDRQAPTYTQSVFQAGVPLITIEAGITDGWWKYIAMAGKGQPIGLDRFGESAPAGQLFEYFGINVAKVLEAAQSLV